MYRRRRWSSNEVEQLVLRYANEGPARLATEFNRSQDAISSLASKCQIRSLTRRTRQAQTQSRLRLKTIAAG